jgi:hypothetical protein
LSLPLPAVVVVAAARERQSREQSTEAPTIAW